MCNLPTAAARERGYTLIELLVVMAVLGVLAAAVFPMAEIAVQRDRERELKRALWEIRDAIDAYKRASDSAAVQRPDGSSGYPPNLEALVTGVRTPGTEGRQVVFLRRIPRDPFAEAGIPAEQTWGLRSYGSPAERPTAGDDVYDVYTRSKKIGLNQVPLREW